MSELLQEARMHVGSADGQPLIVDTGTTPDNVFSALANEHRRHVLAVLSEASAAMDVSTLVKRVAKRLPAEDTPELHRLRVALCHRHLPQVDAAGLVDYDTEDQTVEPTEAMDV